MSNSFYLSIQLKYNLLQVHIKTQITAATRCGQLVLNYKQLCESRQTYLKNPVEKSKELDEDMVFMLDDDDD